MAVTTQGPMQVTSYCNLLVPACHLYSDEVQTCLFHICNKYSMLNATCHLVLTSLARISWGIHFLFLLRLTKWQYVILLNCFHNTGHTQDKNCSGWPLVLSDNSLDAVKLCYVLYESQWENLSFRVNYPTEVYISYKDFKLHLCPAQTQKTL
jgi:hypothetical protein